MIASGSTSQAGMQGASGSMSQAGMQGAVGPNAWDPWHAAAATAAAPTQSCLQAPPGIEAQNYTAKFSKKVAALADFRYDGRVGGVIWHKKMKDYLISKASEIEKILHVVETSEDAPANVKDMTLRPSLIWEQNYGASWYYVCLETPDARSTPPTAEKDLKSGGNSSRE